MTSLLAGSPSGYQTVVEHPREGNNAMKWGLATGAALGVVAFCLTLGSHQSATHLVSAATLHPTMGAQRVTAPMPSSYATRHGVSAANIGFGARAPVSTSSRTPAQNVPVSGVFAPISEVCLVFCEVSFKRWAQVLDTALFSAGILRRPHGLGLLRCRCRCGGPFLGNYSQTASCTACGHGCRFRY